MGIEWTDKTKTEPCMPCFNDLEYYVGRSRVWGIHEAYEKAKEEHIKDHNDLCEIIRGLRTEIQRLTIAESTANDRINEVEKLTIKMNGRKPKLLNPGQIEKAKRMLDDGFTRVQIARTFDVSARTLGRALKGGG